MDELGRRHGSGGTGIIGRMLGAAMLKPDTYEEVEHDTGATWQAALVVILVSVAGGIGGILSGDGDILRGVGFGVIRGLIQNKTALADWKEKLLENPHRVMEAYVAHSQV